METNPDACKAKDLLMRKRWGEDYTHHPTTLWYDLGTELSTTESLPPEVKRAIQERFYMDPIRRRTPVYAVTTSAVMAGHHLLRVSGVEQYGYLFEAGTYKFPLYQAGGETESSVAHGPDSINFFLAL